MDLLELKNLREDHIKKAITQLFIKYIEIKVLNKIKISLTFFRKHKNAFKRNAITSQINIKFE